MSDVGGGVGGYLGLELPTIVQRFRADTSGLARALTDFKLFGSGVDSVMSNVAGGLTKYVSLPLIGLGAAAVATSMKIDDAYRTIARRTGETGSALGDLKNQFDNVFSNVPSSASEVADAISQVHEQLGLSGDKLGELTTKMLEFKEVTGQALDPKALSAFFNKFSISAEQMGPMLDQFYRISQATGANIGQAIGQATGRIGASLQGQYGYTPEQLVTLLAQTQKQGMQDALPSLMMIAARSQKAGVDSYTLLQALSKAASGDNSAATRDLMIKTIGGANPSAKKLETLQAESTQQLMAQVIPARTLAGFEAAAKTGIFSKESLEHVAKTGDGIEAAAAKTRSFREEMEILEHRVAEILKPLGMWLIGTFTTGLDVLTRVATVVQGFFDHIPGPVKTFLGDVIGALAIIGPALMLVMKIGEGISHVVSTITNGFKAVGGAAQKIAGRGATAAGGAAAEGSAAGAESAATANERMAGAMDRAAGAAERLAVALEPLAPEGEADTVAAETSAGANEQLALALEGTTVAAGEAGVAADELAVSEETAGVAAEESAGGVGLFGAALDIIAANPVVFAIAGIVALGVALVELYQHNEAFHDFVVTAWADIQAAVTDAWHVTVDALSTGWDYIDSYVVQPFKTGWTATADAVSRVWDIIQTGWNATVTVLRVGAKVWWDLMLPTRIGFQLTIAIILDLLHIMSMVWNAHWAAVAAVWNTVGRPVLSAVETAFRVTFDASRVILDLFINDFVAPQLNFMRAMFDLAFTAVQVTVTTTWNVISAIISTVWNNVMRPVFDAIREVVSFTFQVVNDIIFGSWSNVIYPVWSTMVGFLYGTVGVAFSWIGDHIGGVWDALTGATVKTWDVMKTTIQDSIHFIGNIISGVLDGASTVADKIGLHNISGSLHDAANTVKSWAGLEAGGRVGTGFKTNGPQAIVGEGNRMYPEYVIPTDPKHQGRARGLFMQLGRDLRMMDAGGVLDTIGGVVGDVSAVPGDIVSAAGSGLDWIGQHVKEWTKDAAKFALEHVWPKMPVPDSLFGFTPYPNLAFVSGTVNNLRQGILDSWFGDNPPPGTAFAGAGGSALPPPGGVSGDLAAWITAAMSLAGVDSSWLAGLEIIAMHESGGNPHAINLTDSNAKAGHPSKGLMQTIDSTFAAHAMSGHGDIWNPVDNAIAAIGYIRDRYGDISNVPGIRSMAHGGAYVGYGAGGIIGAANDAMGAAAQRLGTPRGAPTPVIVVGGGSGTSRNNTVHIYNPKAEPSEDSLHRELQRLAYLGVTG